MEDIKINTTQNVALSYTAAGLGPRMLAIFLDTIFRYVYIILVYVIFMFAYNKSRYGGYYEGMDTTNQVMVGILILFLIPGMLYQLLCETFLNGQSFGKKIVRIKVVKIDGTQPNFGSYLLRSMFRIIDNTIIGLITIAVSQRSQRFGDMVAGTTVIALNKRLGLSDTILHKQRPDHTIVYSQVALLSDKDANLMKEVLEFGRTEAQPEHIRLLAKKIREKYGISGVSQSDEDFLKTLLLDYSHYQFER